MLFMVIERFREGQAPAVYRRFRVLKAWTDNWDDLVEFEIVPVRTSTEAAQAIAPQL